MEGDRHLYMGEMFCNLCECTQLTLSEATPELMAYMAMVVRASQDHRCMAWVRYDAGFRCQAALTKHWILSRTMHFTLNERNMANRCELCFGTTHATWECALQKDLDPEI